MSPLRTLYAIQRELLKRGAVLDSPDPDELTEELAQEFAIRESRRLSLLMQLERELSTPTPPRKGGKAWPYLVRAA